MAGRCGCLTAGFLIHRLICAQVDASQDACEGFEARLRDAHGAVSSAVVADARSEWTLPAGFQDESCPTVVFALELLDNLPHDKVRNGFEGWVVGCVEINQCVRCLSPFSAMTRPDEPAS